MTESNDENNIPETDQPAAKELAAAPAGSTPNRQSRHFKQQLFSRLPRLTASRWEATETLNIYQDLREVVDLDADAFLAPLEPIAEKRHD